MSGEGFHLDDDGVLRPPADLVMLVDRYNTAHVLDHDPHRVLEPTLCRGRRNDLVAMRDLWDTLAQPYGLLCDPTFRAWPPWPCQTCVSRAQDAHRTTTSSGADHQEGNT